MKLLRIGLPGRERPALLRSDGAAFDVSRHVRDYDGRFFAEEGLTELRALAEAGELPVVTLESVRLGPPIARPGQLLCIGLNFRDHARESGNEEPREPIVFGKAANTIVGPNDAILIPPQSTKTDWEIELAVVIGARARYLVDHSAAADVVAGYTISNDVSEREYQLERGGQWIKGKSFETFNPLGPWLVTTDEVGNPAELGMRLWVNDELHQNGTTADMIFDVNEVVWYLSQFMVLEPGDVINTGTPAGVALGRDPAPYLRPGDVVELEIDLLGRQRQVCRATKN